MKKIVAFIAAVTLAASSVIAGAEPAGNARIDNNPAVKAFPDAEGGGMYTAGARGTNENMEVYHVTNLNDSGEGSFRDAVSKGNRIVVFDVSGMIDLEKPVSIGHDHMTILGQTAPGDGICFRGNNVKINAKDIIIRYLRFRVGAKLADGTNTATQDGFSIPIGAEDIIMDHCSVSWGTDENLSVIAAKNVTVQWSIISEALNSSIHAKGEHSYGGIWGGVNVSFHHNILASHKSRNPKIGTSETVSMTPGYTDKDTVVDMWNNIIYNWGDKAGYGAENGANVNVVNNYYKPGPATPDGKRSRIFELSAGNKYQPNWSGDVYASGNYIDDDSAEAKEVSAENWQISKKTGVCVDESYIYNKLENLRESSYLYGKDIDSAEEIYDEVLANAGAVLPQRDIVDSRIVENVKNRTAPAQGSNGSSYLIDDPADGIPDGQENLYDNRGYPVWQSETRGADYDADRDGIADLWEDKMGLDKTNPYDSLNFGPDGYTWLEIFAEDIISPNTAAETEVTVSAGDDGRISLRADNMSAVKAEFYDGGRLIAESDAAAVNGAGNGDTVIAAGYNSDGSLKDIKIVTYDGKSEIPSAEGQNSRIFIWDSITGMKPVEGAYAGYSASAELDAGMNSISAKLYYEDGTSRITPVKTVCTEQAEQPEENVSGDFDIVGTPDNIPNIVKDGFKGIYAGDLAVVCGYDTSDGGMKKVIRYGKISENLPYKVQDNGYKYIKISVRAGNADIYAAQTQAKWDKLSENSYNYGGSDSKAGTYKIAPEGVDYEAVVPWRIIKEQTNPTIKIENTAENERIGTDKTVSIAVQSDKGCRVSEIAVLFNDEIVKTIQGLEIGESSEKVEIPLAFDSVGKGTLKVMCFDENMCSASDSVSVYVSADPYPWQLADVGMSAADDKSYCAISNDNTYTYKMTAPDNAHIGGISDKFGYMYQQFKEDMRLYARLRMQSCEQFGFVLRNNLEPDGIAYYIGGEKSGSGYNYVVKARDTAGGEMRTLANLSESENNAVTGATAYLIAEKAGNKINIYKTENSSTVYTTKVLLYTIEDSALEDSYYMGFGAAGGTGNPADAGWLGLDGAGEKDDDHIWNFDYGLDWCWQSQEHNVLAPKWTNESIGGNDTGKMVIEPDDAYTGERYIFREYIIDEKLMPEMSADVMLTGESPEMNVYFQTGDKANAYKISFGEDKKIIDGSGNVIGEWDGSGFYRIKLSTDINPQNAEYICYADITAPDGGMAVENAEIPSAVNFREQINTEKKTPVARAVYFEPVNGAQGRYYIDNVSITANESEYEIIAPEPVFYTFESPESYDGITLEGVSAETANKKVEGIQFNGKVRLSKASTKMTVPVSGKCKITVYAASANSSQQRAIILNDGAEHNMVFGSPEAKTYEYEGGEGVITIYAAAGVDVYGIRINQPATVQKK